MEVHKAVARLADQLNRMGSKWDYRISHPTNSSSSHISERYAFLWKPHVVDIVSRPQLVDALSTVVEREPYMANFKFEESEFCIVNYHACSHKSNFPERIEIQNISNWIIEKDCQNVLWVGDF